MNWEQVTSFIDKFTNNPTVVAIVAALTALLPLFVLFSKTSFGRKAIRALTSLYNLAERKAAETLKKVEDVEILANQKIAALETEYEEKTEDLKNQYDQKLAAALSFFIFYEETVLSVLDTIPNEKLQKAVAIFKSKLELKKKEITAAIGEIYQNYESAVEHKGEEIRKEYEHKIKFLEDEIKKISLYVNEIKGDNSNGEEREPGETDSNPTQEEIQSNQ